MKLIVAGLIVGIVSPVGLVDITDVVDIACQVGLAAIVAFVAITRKAVCPSSSSPTVDTPPLSPLP